MAIGRWRAALLAGIASLCLVACGPTLVLPPGLHARLSVTDVSGIALAQIHTMEIIAGRVLRPPRILRIEAIRGGPAAPGFDGVTWMVDAEGTFATRRGPSARAVPVAAPTGHFQISDADGSIEGWGFP